ncbi:SDR family oxidoreductase [Streptomyces hyaluromycini]|uniref:SDR family oxidoreductase n=1 Tax=Streptomyces hyaluromycini TaxID=1377993 RepID=A0ABV1X2C0_9ACTN
MTVQSVEPTSAVTAMTRVLNAPDPLQRDISLHVQRRSGRVGTGEEIATAVAFLLSDDASYVNGSHLAVDGGFLA